MYEKSNAVPVSLWQTHAISVVRVPETCICDLTSTRTLSALRVDLSALMHYDLSVPQEWGLAIQQHPSNFGGMKFRSRYNGKACLALFGREGVAMGLRTSATVELLESDQAATWLHQHKVSLF